MICVGPFIQTNMNPFHPMYFLQCLVEIGLVVIMIFSNLLMYFRYFVIISPWKRIGPSFEQTLIPFTQGYFMPNFVEIGPVVLEKNIFLICQCIFAILNKVRGPSFEQT